MNSSSRRLYGRLLTRVLPYWRTFVAGILAMVVLAATEPAVPALLKPMIDGSFVHKDAGIVKLTAVLLVVVFVIRGLSNYLSSIALVWVSGKLAMDLRREIFEKLTRLPSSFFDRNPSGALISKVTFNAAQATDAGTYVLTVLVRDSLAVLGLLAWMLYLDWRLTLIALVAAPLVILVVKFSGRRLRKMSERLQITMGEVTQVLEESVEGHKVIKAFGAQEHERERFFTAANWARRYQMKFASIAQAVPPIAQCFAAVALAVILVIAGSPSAVEEITVGTFVSFLGAMAMLFSPLRRLTGVNSSLQRGLAAAESVFGLIDEPPEIDGGTRALERAEGRLEFRDVSFSYGPGLATAVGGLSFVVEPGETVALVGPSGSGKSTLVNLVPRFYLPTAGTIYLDGIDIADVTLASLRDNIAFVGQEVVLFDDTVAANIAYGPMRGASRDEVEAAARAAHATEFIEGMPEGFDTRIGERGVRLSGGQRQRLAIARAFLKDAPLLILDEAMSSLDSESERNIQAALEALRRGRTTIVIAHRLSTVERADRIMVMSGGRITDSGIHASLLEQSTLYAGLYHSQFFQEVRDASSAAAGAEP